MEQLDKEYQFFKDNKESLLAQHEGKFVVIKGEAVIGVFDDMVVAIEETRKKHKLGTFLVQQVLKNNKIFFHSRVRIKKNAA